MRSAIKAALSRIAALVMAVSCGIGQARADAGSELIPQTFSYTVPAEDNHVRALLELAGVYTVGFTFFLATNKLLPGYDVPYKWPVLRKKLLGEGLELDLNGLNTNFVGHPAGGSSYYMVARSNQLSIAESFAFAFGGSLLWEMFGEIDEFVSINDMIVTPLAGVAIEEPLFALGAFFDRSSPALRNRILGAVFAPVKTLNDALDGRTLARATELDAYGFPANEYHRFDLRTGAAATVADGLADGPSGTRTFEYRLLLSSYLVRLPDYDGVGRHGLWFTDGNVTGLQLDTGWNGEGLCDFMMRSYVGVLGYYTRHANAAAHGGTRGHGTLLAWTLGYQYQLHDYDRDRPRPRDRIVSVQPLGLLLEQRMSWDTLLAVLHVEGGIDFGGVRPYALPGYATRADAVALPELIQDNRYCFVRGAHLLAALSLALPLMELAGSVRYERYEGIDMPVDIRDGVLALSARASVVLGHSPARVSVTLDRRDRRGQLGAAHAARGDTSVGLELGARY